MFGNVATNNKRWEKTKLGNKSVIGSSKRIFANEYTTEGIPFYRSKEIIELGMGEKPSVELYISKKRYQEIKENLEFHSWRYSYDCGWNYWKILDSS